MLAITAAPQWPYQFQGGQQPYAARKLNPSLIAVQVDDPPYQHRARTPQQQAIAVQPWQPEAWPYVFMGNSQPYESPRINPFTAGVVANDPPFDQRRGANAAAILTTWQPDPWPPVFMGGLQPYQPRTLSPSIIAVQVDDPPFRHPARWAGTEIQQRGYQPEIWPYTFEGAQQPYAPAKLPTIIKGVPAVDPPFGIPNKSTMAVIVGAWQPEVWPYVFMGRQQPYEGRKLPVDVSAVPENDPPFTHRSRTVNARVVVTAWQPDPWVYAFMGGKGPFVPGKLAPGTPGSSVDNPPFRMAGRLPQTMSTLWQWQPAVWPYVFMGGHQPYQKGNLPPVITNVPIPVNYRLVIRNQIVRLDNVIRGPGNVTNYPNGRSET